MKLKHFLLSAITLSACSLSTLAHAELITNGTFENYTGPAFSGYAIVNAGSNVLAGWTVGGTSVDIIKGNYGAINGNSIDMLGTPGPGSLSQTFDTVVGQAYSLNFDLSRNGNSAPTINVAFSGGAQTSFLGTYPTVAHHTLNYVATAQSTTLSFFSTGTGNSGAVLDNVSVLAVPEPESYAMLLAGLGLMGTIARRRSKSKGV